MAMRPFTKLLFIHLLWRKLTRDPTCHLHVTLNMWNKLSAFIFQPQSIGRYSFPVLLRIEGWVGLEAGYIPRRYTVTDLTTKQARRRATLFWYAQRRHSP